MELYPLVTRALGGLTVLAPAVALGLVLSLSIRPGRSRLRGWLAGQVRHPIAWAGAIALVATLGSLYFSEVAGLAPCALCWYQRVMMYPLVLVLGVGALRGHAGVWWYGLPLAVVGLLISGYHVWIQYRPGEAPTACGTGVPCSTRYLSVFGIVSIPVMAGAAFLLIGALLLLVRDLARAEAGR